MNKQKYDKLEIPKELSSVVYSAIEEGIQSRENKIKTYMKIVSAVAILLIAFIVPLNTIPSYAQAMQNIPILGEICKIFTFKEYHIEDGINYIDVKIPQITATGKTDLEKRVNQEIIKTINEEKEYAETIAKEYYEAFVETGGDPKEYHPIITYIDYEIKLINEKYVSFVITKNEILASSYYMQYFYNIDMETGKYMTLKDYLGNEYKQMAINSIKNNLSNWDEEKKLLLWENLDFEELVTEDRNFYINNKGQAVIVFGKYEIAAGAAGIIEIPIE